MEIRPIRNDNDHRAALREIEALWDASDDSDEAAKLDVLTALIETYEAKRWPIADPNWDPVDVLRYAIDELGHTQSELAELFGSRSRASEILSRRRPLTVEMIHAIHQSWRIPPELLIRPYRLFKPSAA